MTRNLPWADDILCAWGVHGAHHDQHRHIAPQLATCSKPIMALGLTKTGHPKHPLYLPYALKPEPWVEITAGRWPGPA